VPILPPYPIPSRRRTRPFPGFAAPDIGRTAPAEVATLAELRKRALRERLQNMLAATRGNYGSLLSFPSGAVAAKPGPITGPTIPSLPTVDTSSLGGPVATGGTPDTSGTISFSGDVIQPASTQPQPYIADYLGALFAEAQRTKFLEDLANSLVTNSISGRIRAY